SNSTKFYFDDFYVGSIIVDTLAPKVESILVNSPLTIDVKFDEVVEKNSAENESNYVIDNGIGNVSQVIRSNTDSSIVHITLTTALSYEQLYKLTISGIKDGANNIMQSANFDIIWYNIIKGDVVINEIMCDPSPVVALHDAEWVELYNNSPKQLDLSNWTLQIGSSAKTINYGRIDAHSYIIIGHQDDEYLLAQYGSFIGLSSFSLANSSGKILLKNDLGEIMHYVNYSQNWYKDAAKSDGGWTLEMIDSHNSCGEIDNWAASENLDGGTPAYQNSIKAKNQDKKAPLVERIIVSSNNSLEIYFSESTDSVSVMDITKYKVSEGIGSPFIVQASYPDYKSYTLQFNGNFINEVLYNLEIENGISDCAGNSISEKSILRFGIPQKIDSSDIIINEVLFHPKNNGVDYVEIYNNSDKIIDLKELQLSSWNTEDENWYNINDISKNGFQIFPYEYYVLTTNKDVVMQQYFVAEPNNIIEMESLPSMSNTEGNIFITNKSLQMIDGMEYSDEMHYALLDNPEGISLERLSVSTSALDRSNWHSAATPGRNAEGFGGTPTYENSQSAASISQGEWSRTPEIFSPDNDGLDDYLQINYNMKEPGYTANVSIYDSKGRLIRKLSSGQILGAQGQIIWDGLNDNRQKSKIGIYVILIDYFNLKGDAQATKLTCVLGGDL
ncbi:MAG: lamin tail domain-containing protein, partial [Bacteroidales bacterium]|nr:lamin tail domain-containing protein [Bacteroidales bacterium]